MRAQVVIPVLASILILGTLGLTQNASAITPVSTCSTLSTPGETYDLTTDIISTSSVCFLITADNITFEGNGHTLTNGGGVGNIAIQVRSSTGVTVQNINTDGFISAGVFLSGGASNTVTSSSHTNSGRSILCLTSDANSITNNVATVIVLIGCSDSIITNNIPSNSGSLAIQVLDQSNNNVISGNVVNFNSFIGLFLSDSTGNTVSGNTFDGNALGIRADNVDSSTFADNLFTNNGVGLGLGFDSSGNTVTGNTFNLNFVGFQIGQSHDNLIDDNTLTNNDVGLRVIADSSGNIVNGNTASSNSIGIAVAAGAVNNMITSNTVTSNNVFGIFIQTTNGNTITGNTANLNGVGIRIDQSDDNLIDDNTITNSNIGIHLTDSSENIINGNTVTSNNLFGILLNFNADNNIIHDNTLSTLRLDNTIDGLQFFHNDLDFVQSDGPILLSVNGEGNYWKTSSAGTLYAPTDPHFFEANFDSNNCNVRDRNPYGSPIAGLTTGFGQIVPVGMKFALSPDCDFVQFLENACNGISDIISAISDIPLEDKLEDSLSSCQTAFNELSKVPRNSQAAAGNLEGAVAALEIAIKDNGLDQPQGEQIINQLLDVSRQLADDAIDAAIARGGDVVKIEDAQQFLADGDPLRALGQFKNAANEYKAALAKAEAA